MNKNVLLSLVFALLMTSVIPMRAAGSCQNTQEFALERSNGGSVDYFAPYVELSPSSNCVRFTNVPTDAPMVSIGLNVRQNSASGLFDVFLHPGTTSILDDTFRLTGVAPFNGADRNFSVDVDSFFENSYTVGIVGRNNQDFLMQAGLSIIGDDDTSRCGATFVICEFSNQGDSGIVALNRQILVLCPGRLTIDVTGEYTRDSQVTYLYRPGEQTPVAETNGNSLTYDVSSSDSRMQGFWLIDLEVTGLYDMGNPILRISTPNCGNLISSANASSIRQLAVLNDHDEGVTGVAFSPDGTQLISGSDDQSLILWDVANRSMVRQMRGHNGSVEAVDFAPDAQTVLSGGHDNIMILWNVQTGNIIRSYGGHTAIVESVVYSPDGSQLLSGSADASMILWDKNSGNIMRHFNGHSNVVEDVAYSPLGNYVISASLDSTIVVWNPNNGDVRTTLQNHTDEVESVAFSPDGSHFVSASADRRLILWETESGNMIREFSGHTASVEAVAFSPTGRIFASSGQDNVIRIWTVSNSNSITTLTGHTDRIDSLAFSPDGNLLASASMDGTIRLWGNQ